MVKKICFLFLIISHIVSAEIRTYDFPSEIKASGAYSLKIDGQPVLVIDNPIPASYAAFELLKGPVTVEIECMQDVKWVDVRPLTANIKPQIKDGKISFVIPAPGFFSVEINGKLTHPLFIFADPKEVKPAKNDPNVIYFEAGKIHKAGIISPKSNQHVFIEGGAVVFGAIAAKGVENVKVSGHGILDGSFNNKNAPKQTTNMLSLEAGYTLERNSQRFVEFYDSKNITIEGLILNNNTTWQVVPINCENVTIKGLKLVSDNASDDGIDVVRSRKVRISDCFIRVKDDCIAVKAHLDYPVDVIVDDVIVEKCVFWNAAWGNGIEIGFELLCSEVKNIIFRDIDIIHVESGAVLSIHNSEKAIVKDILFENIRVEDAAQKFVDLAIFRSRYCTDGSRDNDYVTKNYLHGAWDGVLKVPVADRAYHAQFRGKIENIRFNNIYIQGRMPFSLLVGYDDDHAIKDVIFSNIFVNGQKINSIDQLKLYQEYSSGVVLK
jgi:Endopolygalacturonase